MAESANNVVSLRPAPKVATSEASAPVTMPVLRQGARGELVRSMQQNLTSWGFSPGKIDGIFGPKTLEAVQALQRKLGVPATGAMDAQTVEKVKSDLFDVASKLKASSSGLALRVDQPSTPAQASKVAQVAAEEPSSIGKWFLFAALGIGAVYLLSKSKSSDSVAEGEGVEEILAALEGPEKASGRAGRGKSLPERDPSTGRFVKGDKTSTPDELFDEPVGEVTVA